MKEISEKQKLSHSFLVEWGAQRYISPLPHNSLISPSILAIHLLAPSKPLVFLDRPTILTTETH